MAKWNDLQPYLRQMIGDEEFDTWLTPLYSIRENTDSMTLSCDKPIVVDWVRDHLLNDLEAVARSRFGRSFRVHLAEPVATLNESPPVGLSTQPFVQNFTFDRFVVGPSNQFACAASRAVADKPGETYNPLYIYGGSGLGKTHLMHAIAHQSLSNNPASRVVYLTTEQFVNELITCIQQRKMDLFRQTFRGVDILLLDDIQFIAGKERTQEEFFHTINTLQTTGRQVIFTSDSRPAEMSGLEERLRSRFLQGLLADIQPPDLETRCAILREKARAMGWDLPEDVVLFISRKVQNNIRELEGCLNRTIAYALLKNTPLTTEIARKALFDLLPDQRETTPLDIIRFIAQHYGIRVADIKGRSNRPSIVLPRQVAMYLSYKILAISYAEIGRIFSKHHSTAMYAVDTIDKKRRSNPDFDATLTSFTEHFQIT